MPKNTSTGFVIAMFALGFGFGMIWHIAWLIAVGLLGIVGTLARRSLNFYTDYYVKAEEVERIENEYRKRAMLARKTEARDDDSEILGAIS